MTDMEAQNSHLPKARRRQLLGDDRGENIVEFALASTVFFMTLFGIIIFGIGIWQYNMVSDLAQEGARWASVHGTTSASPANQAAVQTYVQSRAPFTVTATTTPTTVGAAGSTIMVRVQHPFDKMISLLPGGAVTLTSDARMIVSR
jgi:Flp pilus assembly protein TadG